MEPAITLPQRAFDAEANGSRLDGCGCVNCYSALRLNSVRSNRGIDSLSDPCGFREGYLGGAQARLLGTEGDTDEDPLYRGEI